MSGIVCTICKVEKPRSEFNSDASKRRGFAYDCRDCNRARSKKYGKTRDWSEHHRKYPEKTRARYLARRAVKQGKLEKLPCVECGEIVSEAHHPDYSKPLDVVWLCLKHHRFIHRKGGQTNAQRTT